MNKEVFSKKTLELIEDSVYLAKKFKSKEVNLSHLMSKIWGRVEDDLKFMISFKDYNNLSEYWFTQLSSSLNNDVDVDSCSLSDDCKNVLRESDKIRNILECDSITIGHILFAIVKGTSTISVKLKGSGITPAKILKYVE